MKKLFISIVLLYSHLVLANSLILKADLDPREIALPEGFKLWSDTEAENIQNRAMREDVMNSSALYLEKKITHGDYMQFLITWAEKGFNQQERIILIDTIQKSDMPTTQKNNWLCRLDFDRNCHRIKIFPQHLAPILQKYDWIVVDGKAYPRVAWGEISISNEPVTWIFLSARFETYTFKGKWEDLKFKNPTQQDWVSGNCDEFTILTEVQSMNNHVLLNRNCIKSSLVLPIKHSTFYEKNKERIWIAAGLILGVGTVGLISGKKVILEKPSFKF